MDRAEDAITELEQRLRRFPARRYPVQHATAQFHLGVALADAGELAGAEAALAAAAATFDPRSLPVEHGKALNALGAVLRLAQRHAEAIAVLTRAVAAFRAAGAVAEEGAARFNLGLVRREAGDATGAAEDLAAARERFTAARAPRAAASAARELGAALFEDGRLQAAREALAAAVELAGSCGDDAGAGMAANLLGLVALADDRPREALEVFAEAVAAHPLGVRPNDYAMAKANLALAHERAGEDLEARVAARQALGVAGAPEPVRVQAAGVLARARDPRKRPEPSEAGTGAADVVALLAEVAPGRRPAIVREELTRWLDGDADMPVAEVAGWIHAQLERPAVADELAPALIEGLLDLPAPAMNRIVRAIVQASGGRSPDDQERLRAQMAMAAARFHVPQMMRIRDAFNAAAAELGQPATWR